MKFNKRWIIGVVAFVIIIAFGLYIKSTKTSAVSDNQVSINAPKKSVNLNKEFSFPIKDQNGNEITKVSYVIDSAQLQDQIVVKGQTATAIKGREFLILNLKLVNSSDKDIQINTRDYIRLSLNGDGKNLLAPDIYNDPVEVQPISTKYTKLGFPISVTDKNLKLEVGEIEGSKSAIPLSL